MEQAIDRKEKIWQELVPKSYHQHGKVFSEKAFECFPGKRWWDHVINFKPDTPTSIDCRVYPLAPKEKEEQKKFIEDNFRLGRIHRSNSPYASGFFLIKKKDGKFRPVQDYQNLNKWTIPNKYPLSLISEFIHNLAGKHFFSKFDIRWCYNNVHIKEGDKWKAAFKTSEGLFEPTVMFFGLMHELASDLPNHDGRHLQERNITRMALHLYGQCHYCDRSQQRESRKESTPLSEQTCNAWPLSQIWEMPIPLTRSWISQSHHWTRQSQDGPD